MTNPMMDDKGLAIEKLVRQAGRGDRQALADLCHAVGKKVLFSVMRLMPRSQDAEDVAQEVLRRLCGNIHTLKDPRAFYVWLNRIVLNEVREHARANAKQPSVLYLEDMETAEDEIPENDESFLPLECVLRQEEQRIVIEIVDELPARQREAVMLHYYQGLSVTEIADVMEIAQQGVSAYLKYARDKVRTGIERRAHKEPGGQIRVLSMLPIGPLMAQAFSQEATLAGVSGNLWTQNTTELCIKNLAGKSSGTPAAANTSATSFFKPVALIAALVVVSICVSAAVMGFGREKQSSPTQEGRSGSERPIASLQEETTVSPDAASAAETGPAAATDAGIIFEGGDADFFWLNPKTARVETGSDDGLTVQDWAITSYAEKNKALHSGTGDRTGEVFANLPDGEYWLFFTLADQEGGTRTLSSVFQISTISPQKGAV